MRSQVLVLLAVCSNLVTSGLVRRRGEDHVHHDKFRRFYNTSSIAPTSDLTTSTPISFPSPSTSTSDINSQRSTLANTPSTSPSPTSSSVFSPVESLALSTSQNLVAENSQSVISSNTKPTPIASPLPAQSEAASPQPTSTAAGTSSVGEETLPGATTKPTSSSASHFHLGGNGNNGIKAEVAAISSASNEPSTLGGTPSQVQSSSPIVQFGPSNSAEFDPVTVTSLSVTPSATGVKYPGPQNGNRAMATGFNEIYKKLDVTSQCNPQDSNQATACVAGELASCQSDGSYVLKSCPDGQSCYALPKQSGGTGIEVSCAIPSVATGRLSAESDAGNGMPSASKVVSAVLSASTPIEGIAQGQVKSLDTGSVQAPVQNPTSSISATVTPSSQAQESSASPTLGIMQSISKLPQTESIQIPVQKFSSASQVIVPTSSQAPSTSQVKATSSSQEPSPKSHSKSSALATTATNSAQRSAEGIQSSVQTRASIESQQKSPTPVANTQASISAQSAKQSAQTLQSFPPAQATHDNQEGSNTSRSQLSSAPAQTQKSSLDGSKPGSAATPTGSVSATIADDGPLFSLPTTTQKDGDIGSTAKAATTQDTGKASQSPSALAQEQHAPQRAAQDVQTPSNTAAARPSSPSNPGDDGVRIVPEGGSKSADSPKATAPPLTNEKFAVPNVVQNHQQGGTPIFITVTVTTTTTAHDLSPTA